MIKKLNNEIIVFVKCLKVLIISVFLIFFCLSCDFFSGKKLLTFYYHAENPYKREVIMKLISDFEKTIDIKVNAIEYFPDDIGKILNKMKDSLDVIELNYLYLSEFKHKDFLLDLTSLPERMLILKRIDLLNYLTPFLSESYLLFANLPSNLQGSIEKSFDDVEELIKMSVLVDSSRRTFGLVVNDGKYSVQNFLTLLNRNGGNIIIESDSISLINSAVIKTLDQYRKLAPYSFIGTKKEVENEFLTDRLNFCLSNSIFLSQLQTKINSRKYSFGYLLDNEKKSFNNNYVSSYLAINKNSKNIEQCVEFVNYITQDKCLQKFQKTIFSSINKTRYNSNNFSDSDLLIIDKNRELYSNPLVNEINAALYSTVYGQDSIIWIVEKTQNRINKLLKQKKHIKYR